ncbi:unnamed protein product [Fusarium graminearum]|nr:unnamed protein product [Fusarium graminearum]
MKKITIITCKYSQITRRCLSSPIYARLYSLYTGILFLDSKRQITNEIILYEASSTSMCLDITRKIMSEWRQAFMQSSCVKLRRAPGTSLQYWVRAGNLSGKFCLYTKGHAPGKNLN